MIYKRATDTEWHKEYAGNNYDPFMSMKAGDAVGWWIKDSPDKAHQARKRMYRYNKNSPYQFTAETRLVHISYGGMVTIQPKRVKDVGEVFLIITKVK
jgi:hypothetical protein